MYPPLKIRPFVQTAQFGCLLLKISFVVVRVTYVIATIMSNKSLSNNFSKSK
jgi:hypothetical protein